MSGAPWDLQKLAPAPHVTSARLDGDVVVYDTVRRLVFHLNGTASDTWSRCDGSRTVHEVLDEVTERYEVSRSVAERDVRALLEQLLADDLLRRVDSST